MKIVAMVVSIMPRQCLANHRDQLRVCGKIDCRGKDEKKGRMEGGRVGWGDGGRGRGKKGGGRRKGK